MSSRGRTGDLGPGPVSARMEWGEGQSDLERSAGLQRECTEVGEHMGDISPSFTCEGRGTAMGATQELKRARPHAENNGNEPASVERSGMRGKIEEPRGALDASSGSVKSGGRARGRDGCWDAGSTRQRRRIRWWIVRALVPIACAILQTPAAAVQPPARAEQLAPQPHAGHTVESPLVGGGTAGELAGEDGLPAGEKNASVRHAGGRKLTDANSDADGWAKDGTIRDELALAEGAKAPQEF